jgi:hypothetical protein
VLRSIRLEVLEERRLLSAAAIIAENALQGTSPNVWDVGFGSSNIEGFATQMSVNRGETIDFKIETDADDYRIDIYRSGYYGGLGARLITTIDPNVNLAHNQPNPIKNAATGMVDAGNWRVSAQWAVPDDATSGVYFANLVLEDGGDGASQIIFVVRDDGGQSDVVYKTSDTTWQAYNNWGGNNLYGGTHNSSTGRAYAVSYNRPMNYDIRSYNLVSFYWGTEYPMVRFMEKNGYDVSYIASTDLNQRSELLLTHEIFVTSGHDEYWSATERSAVEAARDAGVSLSFFGGNDIFWKTYWETSSFDATIPDRTLVSYKSTHDNENVDSVNPDIWTGTWRDPRFSPPADGGLPENALMGTMFMVNSDGASHPITVPGTMAGLRFWRNTSIANLSANQMATLTDRVLGEEWDEDVDNGFRPAGLIHLSSTTVDTTAYLQDQGSNYADGTSTHTLTMYRAASGALVFSAGSQQFVWGLDATHDGNSTTADPRMQQAIVNLFADMGAQAGSLMPGLVPATMSSDNVRPTSAITVPSSGAILQIGIPITITGTAQDGGGGVVAGVEVSVDGGLTWHPATGRSNWTYSWTPRTSGSVTIKSRAIDDSGNIEQPSAGVIVNPPPTANGIYSLWNDATVPAIVDSGDDEAVELGIKFTSDTNGTITGLRFYKSAANTGTHTGNLWTANGQLLASAAFTNETASGWQQVNFSTPVAVTAGTSYVASYHTNSGHYSVTRSYFASFGADSGPLHALNNAASGGNGVYLYGPGGFPASSFESSNYWIDVVLSVTPPVDATAPTVTAFNPASGSANVATNAAATVTFSEALNASTVNTGTVFLRNAGGAIVPTTVAYNAANRTATLTPANSLDISTSYTIVVKGGSAGVKDLAGNALAADATASFTTIADAGPPDPGPLPQPSSSSLWNGSTTPSVVDSGDTDALELGVRFTADTNGTITGIRFYKSAANTGTHTGSLWTSGGQLLATATFTGETASGWQQVNFASPVAITAGTTYVASYYLPVGRYSVNRSYFNSAFTSGALHVPVNGGVYRYGSTSAFPSSSYEGSNYWIDVVLSVNQAADATPPTITAFNPAGGSSNVPTSATATVTFSEALDPATVNGSSVQLRNAASGAAIASTLSYAAGGTVVTLSPTSPLSQSTNYLIVVQGGASGVKDSAGNALASTATSSFATAAPSDTTAPTVTAFNPAFGSANVAISATMAVTFSEALNASTVNASTVFVRNASNVVVAASVAYNSSTNTATITPTGDLANSTTYTIVAKGGAAGVKDLAGNALAADATSSFTTVAVVTPPVPGPTTSSLWPTSTTPGTVDSGDTDSLELGVRFTSDTNGTITGIRFYKSAANTGTHTGSLWTSGGQLLATARFTNETASGWQTVNFSSPVAIAAGTTYVASYHTTSGHYSFNRTYFNSQFTSGALHVPANGGVYRYGATSGFPSSSYQGSNYWVDVLLSTAAAVDTTPPTVTAFNPAGGSANVATTTTATVTFSEALNASTVTTSTVFLRNSAGAVVPTTVVYNAANRTATLTPTSTLANSTTFTMVVKGGSAGVKDAAGNALAVDATSSFTTAVADNTAPTVTGINPAGGSANVATTTTATVTFSEALNASTVTTSTVFLRNAAGAVVPTTVAYNAANRTATLTPTSTLANSTTYTMVVKGGSAGVKDAAGNALAADVTSSFTTGAPVVNPPSSLWATSTTPGTVDSGDTDAVELGVRFSATTDGYITGIRFYKSAANTGPHTASLWTAGGQLLAMATFVNETPSGWQEVQFATPVAITAGTTYVASYHTTVGRYSYNRSYFSSQLASGYLRVPVNGGVYQYGTSSAFPSSSYQGSNYWVDVLFVPQGN